LKVAYPTRAPSKRIACALSHYTLWEQCAAGQENFLILEHDSYFLHSINHVEEQINNLSALIVGINNPIGATRRAVDFYEQVMACKYTYMHTPWIDDQKIPQGIAGNSAYIIKPTGAQALLDLVKEFGLWPNDAIMCRQLIPELWVSTTFYTRVQGTPSTTSL
jgi:GR25 family glycosyltransferase involved in LPS biosynthesis